MALKILLFPFRGIVYLFKHPKLIIIVVILIGAFSVYNHYHDDSKAEAKQTIAPYQKILPSEALAPRIVQTYSRYYPYSTFKEDTTTLTLTDYYVYNKDSWQHRTTPLPIPKSNIVKTYTR